MSSEIFRVGLSLRARSLGRAVPAAATMRTPIHQEAIGIVGVAMAGERTGIWGASLGKIRRGSPKVFTVGDAREVADQADLWRNMAKVLSTAGEEPQLVFPNRQCAKLFAESAHRFCYDKDAEIAAAAELVWWCCTRREIPGSHAAVVLTEALTEQWAVGEDGCDTDDLRIALAWLSADGPDSLGTLRNEALAAFSDPKTSLEFDDALWPKVDRREAERRARAARSDVEASEQARRRAKADVDRQAKNRATVVSAALRPPLKEAWGRLLQGCSILQSSELPHLAHLDQFCTATQVSWKRELQRRERGYLMARKDSARQGAMGLAEAEVATELWEGTLIWGDEMAKAEAIAGGKVLSGTVAESDAGGLTVAISSGAVRARVGDNLILVADKEEISVEVGDVSSAGDKVTISLLWEGMRVIEDGADVTLWPPRPDFGRRYLGWLMGRMAEKHWALGDKESVPQERQKTANVAADPLAAALALRTL